MRRVGLIVVLVMVLGLLLSCASPPPTIPWDPANVNPFFHAGKNFIQVLDLVSNG